jgi:DNA-binding MarR family transcriptional regulator
MPNRKQAPRQAPRQLPRQAAAPPRRTPVHLAADARKAMADCLCWNARLAARRITAHYDAALAEAGLSTAQFGLMAQIAAADDDTLGALAERCGLDPSTLTRNLQALAREGMVEIVAAEEDQRRRAVWLTETGARKLAAAMPVWKAAQAGATDVVSKAAVKKVAAESEKL